MQNIYNWDREKKSDEIHPKNFYEYQYYAAAL